MYWNTASCSAILLKEKVAYSVIPGFSVSQLRFAFRVVLYQ